MKRNSTALRVILVLLLSVVLIAAARQDEEPEASKLPIPVTGQSLRFIALGDQGSAGPTQRQVADAMRKVIGETGIDFVTLLGDNFYPSGVSSVTDSQWQDKFESIYTGPQFERIPFFAVLGNHDYDGNADAEIEYTRYPKGSGRWWMPRAWYSEDIGRTPEGRPLLRVVFLDTNTNRLDKLIEQRLFLSEEMARAPHPVWKMVLGHHPIRSPNVNGRKDSLSHWLLPTMKEYDVDLYLAGHDHNLQFLAQPGEPAYVTSGGGGRSTHSIDALEKPVVFGRQTNGFVLFDVNAKRLSFSFYDAAANRLASYTLPGSCRKVECVDTEEKIAAMAFGK